MNRPNLNFIIDSTALVAFLVLAVTGILMHFTLPPGTGTWASVWGMSRHDWGRIHFSAAVVFFGILLFHLTLHFRWIVCVVRGQKPEGSWRRLILGLIAFIVLISFLLAPLMSPVEIREGQRSHQGQGFKFKN